MVYNMLDWLTSKDALNFALQLGLLFATIGLIVVGTFQARAALAQAEAAEAQVTAANSQAATAKKQLIASLMSADSATRPILRIEGPLGEPYEDQNALQPGLWKSVCRVVNCGLGPALNIEAYYMGDPSKAAGWFSETLGVGAFRTATFVGEGNRITIRYNSTHGSLYETVLESYPNHPDGTFQRHKLVKNIVIDL